MRKKKIKKNSSRRHPSTMTPRAAALLLGLLLRLLPAAAVVSASDSGSSSSGSGGGEDGVMGGAAATVTADEALRIALRARGAPRAACAHDSCMLCTADAACGWCEGTNSCQAGDALGPAPGMNARPCAIWSFGACAGTACRTLETCGDCTGDPDCGWCEGSCSCMDKHASDPTSPAFGECDQGWFHEAGWAKKTCPLHPASHCLAVHLLNANAEREAGAEAAGEAAASAADGSYQLDAVAFPSALRVTGSLVLRGVAAINNSPASTMSIRSGLAKAFGVATDAVAVIAADDTLTNGGAATVPAQGMLPGSAPAQPPALLLLEAEDKRHEAAGFIGSFMKKMLGARKKLPKKAVAKKAITTTTLPVISARVGFEVGSKTPEEQGKLMQKIQEVGMDSPGLVSTLAAAGLTEARSATRAEIAVDAKEADAAGGGRSVRISHLRSQ